MHLQLLFGCALTLPPLACVRLYAVDRDVTLHRLGLVCVSVTVLSYGSPLFCVVSRPPVIAHPLTAPPPPCAASPAASTPGGRCTSGGISVPRGIVPELRRFRRLLKMNDDSNWRHSKTTVLRGTDPIASAMAAGSLPLEQGWGTRGPRATCGPRNVFKRPASLLCNYGSWTYADKTRATSVLCDGCWWRCIGFRISVRFHTDIIQLRHVLFNKCYH